jgi:hypothetical protein
MSQEDRDSTLRLDSGTGNEACFWFDSDDQLVVDVHGVNFYLSLDQAQDLLEWLQDRLT